MKLKVCGMKIPTEIEALQKLTPDYMGLIFYAKSPRYVIGKELEPVWVRNISGVKKIGVFVNESIGVIRQRVEEYGLDGVQLHGQEVPELCQKLSEVGLLVIKAFSIGKENFDFDRLAPYLDVCTYFLFDTKGKNPGGNGVVFNWDILHSYPYDKPFFLSGGIGIEQLDDIQTLSHLPIHAVDINSRFERAPGEKDLALVAEFAQELSSRS